MNCPVCSGRAIGKVGVGQFYCWDCCVEFTSAMDKVVVYDLAEDGSLVAWQDQAMNEVVSEAAME
ncbi:hypothetical protein Desdi_2488 [Desulfitobacterium dichloroeliminans LMG P-21439]|uniref:Uncharacterized protein n=1 Tax=Desulfitobacterium dichloroeliminans (strain LMG P-21439 / DCA1) TaxID=871963 RepID=L0F9M7_DESDL|nr:hypothetical protein [Desulfitobacterium dichloroeliminans]AGA69912.1 hypothetical protein Desdi_2488 [Desulfitobacterium dichloroeliminans LMG P-21439]